MNKRIKELYTQAYESVVNYTPSFLVTSEMINQKFAELIVKECVGVADDYVKGCLCEEHKNIKRPRSTIGRKIQEHFEVEL
jgi:hypothetical protein